MFVDSKIGRQEERFKIKRDKKAGTAAAVGENLKAYDACYAGISVCAPECFPKLTGLFEKKPGEDIKPPVLSGIFIPDRTRVIDIGDRFSLDVTSVGKFKSAEKKLLNAVRKETDGFVSRNFNRYVSLFLSKQLLKLHVSPNQISFTNLLIGLVSAGFILLGGYVNFLIGAVLFQLTSIIDGSDGEVAKLTFQCSKYGAWIDTICDVLTYLAFVASLPAGLYRYYNDGIYMILGVSMLLSFLILYTLMTNYVRKTKSSGSMLKIIGDIQRHAHGPGNGGGIDRFASKITFIFRRDFFAFAFLVFCLFGGAWLYMWGLNLLALLSLIYLYLFSRKQAP